MPTWTPPNGSRVDWWWPGSRPTGITTLFMNRGDQFTVEGKKLRYGPAPSITDPSTGVVLRAVFPVYAESIGTLSRAMELACADRGNPWDLGPDDWKDNGVLEDFAATQCAQGRSSDIFRIYLPGSIAPPAQPPRPPRQPPIPQPPVNPPTLPPTLPPVPPPAAVGLRPLSPASQRAEEIKEHALWAMDVVPVAPSWWPRRILVHGWPHVKPAFVEAVRAWRLVRRHHLGDGRAIPAEDLP